jgi:hypothetical protein
MVNCRYSYLKFIGCLINYNLEWDDSEGTGIVCVGGEERATLTSLAEGRGRGADLRIGFPCVGNIRQRRMRKMKNSYKSSLKTE